MCNRQVGVTLLSSTNDIGGMSTTGWMEGKKNMAAALNAKGYPNIPMLGNGQHYSPVQAASVYLVHMHCLWVGLRARRDLSPTIPTSSALDGLLATCPRRRRRRAMPAHSRPRL